MLTWSTSWWPWWAEWCKNKEPNWLERELILAVQLVIQKFGWFNSEDITRFRRSMSMKWLIKVQLDYTWWLSSIEDQVNVAEFQERFCVDWSGFCQALLMSICLTTALESQRKPFASGPRMEGKVSRIIITDLKRSITSSWQGIESFYRQKR